MIHLQELKGSVPKPVCEESGEKSPAPRCRGCVGDTSGAMGMQRGGGGPGAPCTPRGGCPGPAPQPWGCAGASLQLGNTSRAPGECLAAEGQQGHTHGWEGAGRDGGAAAPCVSCRERKVLRVYVELGIKASNFNLSSNFTPEL